MSGVEVTVDPSQVGVDARRLSRIDDHFRRYVDDGRLPGWQITVARAGEVVHASSYGWADVEAKRPIVDDTIFRIYSMTKPLTCVAALMLWEEGAFELKDPVSGLIPSFAEQRVFTGGTSQKPVLGPVTHPMEIWHLMSHTSGLTYGFMYSHPVDELYRVGGFEWGVPQTDDLAGLCDRLARLPLLFQPGSEWAYSMATDVLGRVVELASGMPLDEFLRTRILDPLGMVDTAFWVPEESADRLATLYGAHPGKGAAVRLDAAGQAALHRPSAWLGGGGLVSTSADYLRFAEMLRRGGELDGVRILSPRTVRYMASNHLPRGADLTAFGRPLFSETTFDGVGFGLGVSVTIDPVAARVPGSVGDFGWGGAASTVFTVDPVEDLSILFMTQLLPSSTHPIRSQLKQLVHQALVD